MEVGVLVTATAQSGDLAEVARRVEAEGFDSLWIPEHPVIPVGHQTPFPAAADGLRAIRTRRAPQSTPTPFDWAQDRLRQVQGYTAGQPSGKLICITRYEKR